jgi:fumarate reductase subunit D
MATSRRHTTAYRRDLLWIAALVHRISGVALAAFLPLHFLVLGLALQGEVKLDGFLKWTANPAVKLAETVLVGLLAVHLLGGLRVLLVEATTYR